MRESDEQKGPSTNLQAPPLRQKHYGGASHGKLKPLRARHLNLTLGGSLKAF
jgi:hypothetical protein